jgi:hypothetical protein
MAIGQLRNKLFLVVGIYRFSLVKAAMNGMKKWNEKKNCNPLPSSQ